MKKKNKVGRKATGLKRKILLIVPLNKAEMEYVNNRSKKEQMKKAPWVRYRLFRGSLLMPMGRCK